MTYPPQYPDNYGMPPAPQRRKIWPWIVGALALLLICGIGSMVLLGAGVKGAADAIETAETNRTTDVKITACSVQPLLEGVEISYTIVNSSKQAQPYAPQFEIVGPDRKTVIGTAADFTTDVQPGATLKGKTFGTLAERKGKISCRVTGA